MSLPSGHTHKFRRRKLPKGFSVGRVNVQETTPPPKPCWWLHEAAGFHPLVHNPQLRPVFTPVIQSADPSPGMWVRVTARLGLQHG